MTLFDRIGRLLRANLNDLLARVEDPEKILAQALMDMKNAYRQAKEEVAGVLAEEARLSREVRAYRAMAETWRVRAREAVKAGRDDLAREALKKARQAEALAEELDRQLKDERIISERLKAQLEALRAKIAEAEAKKRVLVAKRQTYRAAESVRSLAARTDAHPAAEAFEAMAEKIEAMADRHQALAALDAEEGLEEAFASLNEEEALDAELARLKAEVGES